MNSVPHVLIIARIIGRQRFPPLLKETLRGRLVNCFRYLQI